MTAPSIPALAPLELLDLEGLLSPRERTFAGEVRALMDATVRPEVGQWYLSGRVPTRDLVAELGRAGLIGMQLPGYGASVSPVEYGLGYLEVEAADSGVRSLLSVQGSLAMQAIHDYGSDTQRAQWLGTLARGESMAGFALTEPEAGSDPGSLRTTARRDGSDWVLDGHKRWILNGSEADVLVVWARTEEGVRAFLVPTGEPGVSRQVIPGQLSLRVGRAAEMTLAGVRLPADALLPGAKGLRDAFRCLNEARFGIIFGPLGAARDSLEGALAYTAAREQFGRPLAGYQLTQAKLVQAADELAAAFALAVHLGRAKEAGRLRPDQIALGKRHSCQIAMRVARSSRTMMGANGITTEHSALRHALNLESVMTYEGAHEVMTLVLGKSLTGLDAFR